MENIIIGRPTNPLRGYNALTWLFMIVLLLVLACFWYSVQTAKTLEEVIADDKIWRHIKDLPIADDKVGKLIGEIERVKSKPRKGNPCDQYTLRAKVAGVYPCFHSPQLTINLREGEIWKIGKTCLEEEIRYSRLPDNRLVFVREYSGTAEECLIIEKYKIYAYARMPENQARETPLILPPGNKIFR
jgi:hypothetical protein